METLIQRLKMLETKHPRRCTEGRCLRVFYGWSRLNKTQRREAIDIAFENEEGAGSDERRFIRTLRKAMDIVAERDQTPAESMCASGATRMFSVFHIFLDQPGIDGSLERAVAINRRDDEGKGIPDETLDTIASKLREHYMDTHPGYREPELPGLLPFAD